MFIAFFCWQILLFFDDFFIIFNRFLTHFAHFCGAFLARVFVSCESCVGESYALFAEHVVFFLIFVICFRSVFVEIFHCFFECFFSCFLICLWFFVFFVTLFCVILYIFCQCFVCFSHIVLSVLSHFWYEFSMLFS